MRRSLVIVASTILMTSWFAACKSGTTNPTTPPDYMPMSEGNYWVYESYDLDSTGNRTGQATYDSVVVGAALQLSGRTASPFYHFYSDGSKDTLYFSKDADGNLWQYFTFEIGDLASSVSNPPTIPPRWVKVASVGSETSWTILDTTFTDIQVQGQPITFNLTVKVTISKAGTESVTVGGKSYTAQKFSWKTDLIPSLPLFTASFTATDWAVSGVGYAKQTSQLEISVPMLGMSTKSGTESTLLRYSVR
ncbi:MAG: hypothetical protein KatS3mg039_0492 [Candidatus Kapaibacterium sp.]|nr:MAG: hypothetical protein KatS3mg039_0492 [Candidatus Kapabacteria bacterium]